MNNSELIYTIMNIYPSILLTDHGTKYWVGRYVRGGDVLSEAFICEWLFEDKVRPTEEQIASKWEQIKDEYKDPFLLETFKIPLAEFRKRFTRGELIDIKIKLKDDIDLSVAFDDLSAMVLVNLKGEDISNILDVFVASKVITKTRKKELLKPSVK